MKFAGKFVLLVTLIFFNYESFNCRKLNKIKSTDTNIHPYSYLELSNKDLSANTLIKSERKKKKSSADNNVNSNVNNTKDSQQLQQNNGINPNANVNSNTNLGGNTNSVNSGNINSSNTASKDLNNTSTKQTSKISVKKMLAIGKAIYNRLYVYEGSLLYKLKKLNVLKDVKFEELNNNIIVQGLKSIFDDCKIKSDSIKALKDQFDIGFEEGLKWLNENGKIEFNGKFTYSLKNEVQNNGGCENDKSEKKNENNQMGNNKSKENQSNTSQLNTVNLPQQNVNQMQGNSNLNSSQVQQQINPNQNQNPNQNSNQDLSQNQQNQPNLSPSTQQGNNGIGNFIQNNINSSTN